MTGGRLDRFLAELIGTSLLVGIGTGAIVAVHRAGGELGWILAIAWFAAVTIPIFLFIRISGAHLNPVVTLALATSGRVGWREVPLYVTAQFAGAFVGSLFVLSLLGSSAHLGATVPLHGEELSAFAAEFSFTALLIASVFFLADRGQGRRRWRSFLPGLAVGISTYLIGPLTGSSLNPARTIAPAIVTATYDGLWVYLIAVPLGALIVASLWKPKAVDLLDRGTGRTDATR